MQDPEGFVTFIGQADEYYGSINSSDSVAGLWEQLIYAAQNPNVDFEAVFELTTTEDGIIKIIYGPPFNITFRNLPNGKLVVYSILNTGP